MSMLRAGNDIAGRGIVRTPISARTTIDPRLFARFQALIYKTAGIWLSSSKTALLCGRLARRLRSLGLETMEEYFELVTSVHAGDEMVMMLDAITTNETHFFREPKHFEFMRQRLFPRWKKEADSGLRTRSLRIWSAGCSSGEEPYSLAMVLLQHFPASGGWTVDVLATDISTQVLARAKAGIYPVERAADIPRDLLATYMLEGTADQAGKMRVGLEAHQIVEFDRVNLNDDSLPVQGPFDAIFCRNVLIYFDMESKKKVISNLARHMAKNGLLFVGHSENLAGVTDRMKTLAPTIYGFTDDHGQLIYDFRLVERNQSAR